MVAIGYHASHEQFAPEVLKDLVQAAEQAGFAHAMCSDHFHPWGPEQGNSAFAWSWLGSALEATALTFGTVTPPIDFRYHPTMTAQAAATLARMYPERFEWLALGTGEALNEHVVGRPWPPKQERDARLAAAAEIIRALWRGETVTRRAPIPVDEARLYCRPEMRPHLFCAALTPETAALHASWADGLLTVNQPMEKLEKLVEAYRKAGGKGGLFLQVHLSWAESDDEAVGIALEHWRANLVPPAIAAQLRMPEEFSEATATVRAEDIEGRILCAADPSRHVESLRQFGDMGFERLYLHFVGPEQRAAIELFGSEVLPQLAERSP